MNKICHDIYNHCWNEIDSYSNICHKVKCSKCNLIKVVKPKKIKDPKDYYKIIAINEFLSYKLMDLLKSKGLEIFVPKIELANFKNLNNNLWDHSVAFIEYLGNHSRITSKNINSLNDNILPNWLYYFDRWVGRIDGNGDTNLLLVNNKAIPIDFNLSFIWCNPYYSNRWKVNDLNVPYHDKIKKIKNEDALRLIKSLSDEEIYNIFTGIDENFIYRGYIDSCYSGLLLRRDLL